MSEQNLYSLPGLKWSLGADYGIGVIGLHIVKAQSHNCFTFPVTFLVIL